PIKREDISTSLKGKPNIMNQLRDVLLNAKKEVIICTDVDDIISKMRIFKQIIERLKSAKINLKIALNGDQKTIQKLSNLFEIPIKSFQTNGKFFIADRKEALFYISKNSEDEEIAVWLNSPFFSEAMTELFEKAFRAK
ncbi:MAG: TrmB family transcriptional regulator sugar-binding domain-containing protein, partial [Nanoarchaeota archaeon]